MFSDYLEHGRGILVLLRVHVIEGSIQEWITMELGISNEGHIGSYGDGAGEYWSICIIVSYDKDVVWGIAMSEKVA
jgi:hypothetical protein